MRSGRPDMFKEAKAHLEHLIEEGLKMARLSSRVKAGTDHGTEDDRYLFLRITIDDYAQHAAESGLAAMRALHGKPAEPWTVEKLAALANMSRSAFAARFKARLGEAPLEYGHVRKPE